MEKTLALAWFVTVLFVCSIQHSLGQHSRSYLRNRAGLTRFPRHIPKRVTIISLNDNKLTRIPTLPLYQFDKLAYLYLRGNQFTEVPDLSPVGESLRYLSLSHNPLHDTNTWNRLDPLIKLETLYLGSCGISHPPYMQVVKGTLKALGMYNNLISTIPYDYFSGFTQLRSLTLRGNQISHVPYLETVGPSLLYLYLNENPLQSANWSSLHGLQVLQKLYLSKCGLREIPNIGTSAVYLEILNLSSNNISSIPRNFFERYESLKMLHLQNNNLRCCSPSMDLLGLIQQRLPNIKIYISCGDPPNFTDEFAQFNAMRNIKAFCTDADTNITTAASDTTSSGGTENGFTTSLGKTSEAMSVYVTSWSSLEPMSSPGHYSTSVQQKTSLATSEVTSGQTKSLPVEETTSEDTSEDEVYSKTEPVQTEVNSTEQGLPAKKVKNLSLSPTSSSPQTSTLEPRNNNIVSWVKWLPWSACSRTCGTGTYFRIRLCKDHALHNKCAKTLVWNNGNKTRLIGYSIQYDLCTVTKCPVDGVWLAWGPWSSCSATCGEGSVTQFRLCEGPFYGGMTCQGIKINTTVCTEDHCPITRMPVVQNAIQQEAEFTESDQRPTAQVIGISAVMLFLLEAALLAWIDARHIRALLVKIGNRNI